jgi:hypothetical protein
MNVIGGPLTIHSPRTGSGESSLDGASPGYATPILMRSSRRPFDPALALLLALLAIHAVIVLTHFRHPLITDEVYYVAKGQYLSEHHRFAPADPVALAVERGEAWGNSDWRPPGYAIFLATVSGGDFHDPAGALRLRVTIAQLLMVAVSLLALYRVAIAAGAPRYAAAILLGVPPWTFFAVNEIGPDPENVFFVTCALLLLWRWIVAERHGMWWLISATAVATAALFFRPEMIVMPPFLVAAAMLLRTHVARVSIRQLAAAALIYCALVGLEVAYRTWFTGHAGVFGGLHIYNRGAFDWADTWPGTEKETYDFVYAIGEGKTAHVPERAFDSAAERDEVLRIAAAIAARGRYTAADDEAFERLARQKKRDHPLRVVLLRGWHTIHLWVNVENNPPLLEALSPVPRAVRRPFYGGLLLLRIAALAFACVALVRGVRELRQGRFDDFTLLVLLLLFYVVARSVLTGLVLNWNVHRLVLSAWPPLLCCAAIALRKKRRIESQSIASPVVSFTT